MLEYAPLIFAVMAALFGGAAMFAVSYRDERNKALADLKTERADYAALSAMINPLAAETVALEAQVKTLSDGFNTVANERDALKSQLADRISAEADAKMAAVAASGEAIILTPKRDGSGRFLPKPKAQKPAKTAKPIACG